MLTHVNLEINSINRITRENPVWSDVLSCHLKKGYQISFKYESPVNLTDTIESIADFFDELMPGDFTLNSVLLTGFCVFLNKHPEIGTYVIPLYPEYLTEMVRLGRYRLDRDDGVQYFIRLNEGRDLIEKFLGGSRISSDDFMSCAYETTWENLCVDGIAGDAGIVYD